MFRSPGKRPLSTVLGALSVAAALSSVGGCHAILGLDKYEKGDASGGQGGDGPTDHTGGQGGGDGGCTSSAACNDNNPCTEDVCTSSGKCETRTKTAGEKCAGGVCNGRPGEEACQRCVDDQPGDLVDAGCTDGAPQCRTSGKVQCVGCEKHSDCDDNNDCTIDSCSGDGTCGHRPEDPGAACDGGVCNGVEDAEACIDCVDSEEGSATDDGCDVTAPLCSSGKCEICVDDKKGAAKDLGCDDAAPICSGSGCVECKSAGDCTAPNDECATVACDDGSCVVTLHDDQCTGDDGCPGTCKESGCQTTALTGETELVSDPSLEEEYSSSPWYLAKAFGDDDFGTATIDTSDAEAVFIESDSAHSGDRIARFKGTSDVSYDIYQPLDFPEGTKVLVVSGYYRSVGAGSASDDNYFDGAFFNYASGEFHDYFVSTKVTFDFEDCDGCSVSQVASEWTKFEWRITDFSSFPKFPPDEPASDSDYPEINIFGRMENQTGLYYEIDDISVKALVCE